MESSISNVRINVMIFVETRLSDDQHRQIANKMASKI